MRKLPDTSLPSHIQAALDDERDALDRVGGYAARVLAAEAHWNSARGRVVNPVREVLRMMCGDVEPCCYCENSIGAQVEHVRPKSLYPERTFDWRNLLLVCGGCNTIKQAEFAVLIDGRAMRVSRRRDDPIIPPPAGQMALVDLRCEDPLDFFQLNLQRGTIWPRRALGDVELERAEFTLTLLQLNRDPLPTWRVQSYGTFRARLHEYIRSRQRHPEGPALAALRTDLLRLPQQMVWREMQRQHAHIPELRDLFSEAPEALDW